MAGERARQAMKRKPPLSTRTLNTSKSLRTAGTDAEHSLWYRLRTRRLDELKFRRQHPLSPFVADFYCDELKLVVELDGSQHAGTTDAARTQALERQGLTVLRFWDNQVLLEMKAVLAAILNFAQGHAVPSPPTPRPRERGVMRCVFSRILLRPPCPNREGTLTLLVTHA